MAKEPKVQKTIEVDVLGRGKEQVTIDSATNIKELRSILNLDKDVKAYDEKNKRLSDKDSVSTISGVRFSPNVQGGC